MLKISNLKRINYLIFRFLNFFKRNIFKTIFFNSGKTIQKIIKNHFLNSNKRLAPSRGARQKILLSQDMKQDMKKNRKQNMKQEMKAWSSNLSELNFKPEEETKHNPHFTIGNYLYQDAITRALFYKIQKFIRKGDKNLWYVFEKTKIINDINTRVFIW